MRRSAAATRLIALDVFSPLADTIRRASPETQFALLKAIAKRSKPVPGLRETLYTIAGSALSEIRAAAVRVLCAGCPPEEAVRLAEAAAGDSSSYQAILQRAGLPPESLARLGEWLLERSEFRIDQYGMRDIAKRDRMPADFVPRNWHRTGEPGRKELCGFAECQLEEYADEDLHRFLVGVAFGQESVALRAIVWTTLYRWYRHMDGSGKSPIAISMQSIERFFNSPAEFLATYTRFLQDNSLPELLKAAVLGDPVCGLIRYPNGDVLPAFAQQPAGVSALAGAISSIANDARNFEFILRTDCISFLGWLGQIPEFRDKMRARIVAFQGTDLDHACNTTLERLNPFEAETAR